MTQIISIANQKGGVGKTTSTINLGVALAHLQRRVLLIDLDPQGALSAGLGVKPGEPEYTVYEVLMNGTVTVNQAIIPVQANLDLLPADNDLAAAEVELIPEFRREMVLRKALVPLNDWYDYILIDCPPSLGILTINALVAADRVLVPVQAEYLGLRGLALFWQTMQQVEPLNAGLRLLGILPTMIRRTKHHVDILAALSQIKAHVFEPIPLSVKASEAHAVGRAVSALDGDNVVAQAYAALAGEVERLW